MEWRTIDECPADTAVLLYDAGYVVGHWNTKFARWCTYTDGAGTTAEVRMNRFGMGPTHWQPLPDPPAEVKIDTVLMQRIHHLQR